MEDFSITSYSSRYHPVGAISCIEQLDKRLIQ